MTFDRVFLGIFWYFCPLTSYRSHVLAQEPNENMILRNISRNDLRAFFRGTFVGKNGSYGPKVSFKYRNTILVMYALYEVEKRIILIYIFYDIRAWWPKSHNFGIWIFVAGHCKPKVSSAAWCCACFLFSLLFSLIVWLGTQHLLEAVLDIKSITNWYVTR